MHSQGTRAVTTCRDGKAMYYATARLQYEISRLLIISYLGMAGMMFI